MKKIQRGAELPDNNEATIIELSNEQLGMAARPLLMLLAQCCDMAAKEGSCWISLGATRKLDSLVLTVHQPEGPLSLYANDLGGILTSASSLL